MRRVVVAMGAWVALVAVVWPAGRPARSGVIIEAKVGGKTQKIGELDAAKSAKDDGRVIGEFKFDKGFEFLDDWYDFQWVNVEVEYQNPLGTKQANDPVLGKLPAIDPQPPPKDKNEDNKPFYWNDKEWNPPGQKFAEGLTIHEEGKLSRFIDRPSDGTKDSLIKFMTYLVLDNLTDPALPKDTFYVLGVFDWEYQNNKKAADGVSTVTRVAGTPTLDATDTKLINDAIKNANDQAKDLDKDAKGFGAWKADLGPTLTICPEPASILLALAGAGTALGMVRRRGRRPAT